MQFDFLGHILESSNHFTYLRPLIVIIHIRIFWHHIFKILQKTHAAIFFWNCFFYVRFGISAPKDIIMAGVKMGLLKKCDHNMT